MYPGRQDLNVNRSCRQLDRRQAPCRPLGERQAPIFKNFSIRHIFLNFFLNIKMKKALPSMEQPVYRLCVSKRIEGKNRSK